MSDMLQERLQKGTFPCRFFAAPMNDFPTLEDRSVTKTAAGPKSASLSEDNVARGLSLWLGRNQQQSAVMNDPMNELIVSGIHLELTPSLKTYVQQKTERLFRHEEHIVRLRVELECDAKQAIASRFTAKGHIQIQGPDMNASVSADECHKAVALLVDKLDRMLRRRARLSKAKRNSAPTFDRDLALSKAI